MDLRAAPLDGKAKLALQAAVALMAVGGGVFGARPTLTLRGLQIFSYLETYGSGAGAAGRPPACDKSVAAYSVRPSIVWPFEASCLPNAALVLPDP